MRATPKSIEIVVSMAGRCRGLETLVMVSLIYSTSGNPVMQHFTVFLHPCIEFSTCINLIYCKLNVNCLTKQSYNFY